MISSRSKGYAIDPKYGSSSELVIQLDRFSFARCAMLHEKSKNPGNAAINCSYTKSGFNLGCAHPNARKHGLNAASYLHNVIYRLLIENIISEGQCQDFIVRSNNTNIQLFGIDVLQRNAQPARMAKYSDWLNNTEKLPVSDRKHLKMALESIAPGSLVRKLMQKCYDSFGARKVGSKVRTTLSDPEAYQLRIKLAQILVASDYMKLVSELKSLCRQANFDRSSVSWDVPSALEGSASNGKKSNLNRSLRKVA